jgi:hypothetical protein
MAQDYESSREALEALRSGNRAPAAREAAVEFLADLQNPLGPAGLGELFTNSAPRSAQLDGAQIAARRLDWSRRPSRLETSAPFPETQSTG